MTEIEYRQHLVRMGKGQAQTIKPVACGPFMGAQGKELFDREQSEINRKLGYWK